MSLVEDTLGRIVNVGDNVALRTFLLDEDPNHLEEAVLIAMDHMNEDRDRDSGMNMLHPGLNMLHSVDQDNFDRNAFAIQRGEMDRRQNMRLVRYVAGDNHGNNQ